MSASPAMLRQPEVLAFEDEPDYAPVEVSEGDGIVLDPEEVSGLAYGYWLERGCPNGSPDTDWFRAESELKARIAAADTEPPVPA